METIEADLRIELNVGCPHCEDYFDLFDIKGLNEDCYLINSACPDGSWKEAHEKFEEKINCPSCGEEIHIEGIAW